MGEVYLARDVRLDRTIALKLLSTDISADQQRMQRFTQEAKAASALNHPNIITIFEIDQADAIHFIATEFINGTTLREQIARAQLSVGDVLDIAVQIASALTAAHEEGIMHRDIKPENVMLRPDGLVKVLDFGLAKLTSKPAERHAVDSEMDTQALVNTNPGVVMGTVSYMSPEQARGQAVDARTDIWSLGAMLYEMLAGRVPFAGESMTDVLALILHKEPTQLARYAPEVPPELERIITKALRKNKDERYQTIKDMAFDLRSLKQRLEFEAELERTVTPEESAARASRGINQQVAQALPRAGSAPPQATHPTNLSAELSPLIGREREVASVKELLRREGVRLVTLTGIGGTGKTSLAQQVARELLVEFADGVFLVELSSVTAPDLVAAAVAQSLGIKEVAGASLAETLKETLRERALLIVLDNFEQVTAAAPLIMEFLSAASRLKVLVTSRALLHLRLEQEFTVLPLALPSTNRLPPVDEIVRYAAVTLFVERATAVKPGFTLTEDNAHTIVEICTRLDGLPLAIELAAARVKLLSPQAILARLENRLKLLTGGARDLPARQQTMRGAITWSYDLLDDGERVLLNRLSVFAGGCPLEAAEAVCNAEGDLAIEVLDGIGSLVDKSLLVQREQADGESRFRMLEIVREYGLECLQASGEDEAVKRQHANYYLARAEEAEPELEGAHPAPWLERLEEEHENLRAALQWSTERDPDIGLRFTGALNRFWVIRGHLTEGRRWLDRALESGRNASVAARSKALVTAGDVARNQGDLASARSYFEEGLLLSREVGNMLQIALSYNGLSILAIQQGDYQTARPLWEECLVIARKIGDKRLMARTLNNLGEVARSEGDYEAARSLYEESLEEHKRAAGKELLAVTYCNLGAVAYQQADYSASRSFYQESLHISEELGDKGNISLTLDGFAAIIVKEGQPLKAAQLAGAADALRKAIGYILDNIDREFRDRYVAEIRAALGDEAFTTAVAQGRAMKSDEASTLAIRSTNH